MISASFRTHSGSVDHAVEREGAGAAKGTVAVLACNRDRYMLTSHGVGHRGSNTGPPPSSENHIISSGVK